MERIINKLIILSHERKLIGYKKILELRLVNRAFKNVIDSQYLYHYLAALNKIKQIMTYDKTVCDQYYYKRIVEAKKFGKNFNEYEKLTLSSCSENASQETQFPGEYYILLNYYNKYPSTKIKFISPEFLKELLNWQKSVNQIDVLFLVPIVYVEHYSKNKQDTQYVSILFYTHTLGSLSKMFTKNHYFSTDFELKELTPEVFEPVLELYCKKITTKMLQHDKGIEYIPENIASKNKPFADIFTEFCKKQQSF
jgi:hypothetical protein